jgi:hypothetical protein
MCGELNHSTPAGVAKQRKKWRKCQLKQLLMRRPARPVRLAAPARERLCSGDADSCAVTKS